MGSDHYCLRWNNHQSNLLGVFSQLLRDESLVDVTLACSEGHSIRAHKVVLSACSSYFQTLFVDHPARHPIVILKDVRFAELSTLIEFMYHGEVNVEHCQLSELLRTAESLKVKGLTDMGTTNLPATGLQPPPGNKVQLQTPSQLSSTTCNYNTSSASGSSTSCCKTETPDNNNPAAAMAEPEQTEPTELVIKPHKPSTSLSIEHSDREELNPMVTAVATCVTTSSSSSTGDKINDTSAVAPISLVASEKRSSTATVDQPISQQHQFHMPPISQPDQNSNNSTHKDSPTRLTLSPHAGSSIESENLRPDSDMDEELDDSCDESEDYKPSDMRLLTTVTTEANRLQQHDGNSVNLVAVGAGLGPSGANSVGMLGILGRLPSPIIGTGAAEPIAGPSNILPPVQQVPLSLKKEVDWGGASADEKSNVGSPSDYPRHSLDPSITDIERCFITTSPATSSRQSSSRSSTPAFTALPQAQQLPATVDSIAAAVVGYHQQHHHNLTSSLLEAGLVHPALFNAAAAAAVVAAAGVSAAAGEGDHLYRCNACMAAFPSIWLLEQHTALQHIGNLGAASTSSSAIDKPFVCEQCGQSYRYRSAYVKHREQNHRARLPADKLFSCDFCGMQFRYLKSFKKHRLNHALERLHGKANSETRLDMMCSREISSGGKDTSTPQIDSIAVENSSDQVSSSNETLTITDDQPRIPSTSACKPDTLGSPQLITDTEDNDIENPSTSGHREHIIVDSDPMQLAGNTSDSEPEVEQEQDDTIDSAAAAISSLPTVKVVPVAAMLPSTSAGACSAILPSLGAPSELPGVAGGSMATAEAVEAFRSAQQASIINFLRADAAERQRERRFACPFCGKCVRSKENLKLHVRKHTGERPFVCLFCGRAFGGKSDLTRHLRIHTGERPYHCDMCGKCFARADYLSKHLTTHINTPR